MPEAPVDAKSRPSKVLTDLEREVQQAMALGPSAAELKQLYWRIMNALIEGQGHVLELHRELADLARDTGPRDPSYSRKRIHAEAEMRALQRMTSLRTDIHTALKQLDAAPDAG